VVAAWVAEKADYDYASNSCASGKVCGHYTQIVWRETTAVGCGVARNADATREV
ncbi:MAG: CAP domain-containing protein, partial [Cyanobacteria bacterium P01_C01_bin.70]